MRSFYFYRSIFNRIRSADDVALKYGRNFSPDNRCGHDALPPFAVDGRAQRADAHMAFTGRREERHERSAGQQTYRGFIAAPSREDWATALWPKLRLLLERKRSGPI